MHSPWRGMSAMSSSAAGGSASSSARPFLVLFRECAASRSRVDFVPAKSSDFVPPAPQQYQQLDDTAGNAEHLQARQTMRAHHRVSTRSRESTPASGSFVAATGLKSHSPSLMAHENNADRQRRAHADAERPRCLVSSCSRAATSARVMAPIGNPRNGSQCWLRYLRPGDRCSSAGSPSGRPGSGRPRPRA